MKNWIKALCGNRAPSYYYYGQLTIGIDLDRETELVVADLFENADFDCWVDYTSDMITKQTRLKERETITLDAGENKLVLYSFDAAPKKIILAGNQWPTEANISLVSAEDLAADEFGVGQFDIALTRLQFVRSTLTTIEASLANGIEEIFIYGCDKLRNIVLPQAGEVYKQTNLQALVDQLPQAWDGLVQKGEFYAFGDYDYFTQIKEQLNEKGWIFFIT